MSLFSLEGPLIIDVTLVEKNDAGNGSWWRLPKVCLAYFIVSVDILSVNPGSVTR